VSTLRITVIGGGSVGLGLAASFAIAGAGVTLMVRAAAVETLRTQPVTVAGLLGEHRVEPGRIAIEDGIRFAAALPAGLRELFVAELDPAEPRRPFDTIARMTDEDAAHPTRACLDCDVLVVTTKAYDVADALRPYALPGATDRPRAILLMQNGLGSAEAAREVMGPDTPIFSTANRPAENGLHYVEGTLIPVVIPRAASHRSSMVQDLESGRRTEIDYLNGAIVRMGHEVGIDTPFHQSVVALIHARFDAAKTPVGVM
jgi:ketopantoate reductase